jgi:hypothetical protein
MNKKKVKSLKNITNFKNIDVVWLLMQYRRHYDIK